MLDPESILRLYANVLHNDIVVNAIPIKEIRSGVQSMAHVYAAENSSFETNVLKFPNFNDSACRCAYLHKFAPLHTYIVFDAMLKILQTELTLFRNLINSKRFNICSIGGGPGSDVVGALAAMKVVFSSLTASVTIVDCMEKWGLSFKSVIQELKFGGYGTDWHIFANDLDWNYLGANLLCKMSDVVNKAIGSASFITMMKFVSACACTNTEEMVDKIFRVMKAGALVLYIDNAAGGYTQLIERSSRRNGLVPVFGPLRHVAYDAEALKIDRFGYTSCYKTKVTIILLQKPFNQQDRKNTLAVASYLDQRQKPHKSLDFVVLDNNKEINNRIDVNKLSSTHEDIKNANLNCNYANKFPNKLNNLNRHQQGQNSDARQTPLSTSRNVNVTPVRPERKSRPNSGSSSVQRTQPTASQGNNGSELESPQELKNEYEDACCSCCVIS